MPAITFSDFSGGLDRRLPVTVQDSSRLWILRNARITLGKRIAKREGLKLVAGIAGTVGLVAVAGRLNVFQSASDPTFGPFQINRIGLTDPSSLPAGQSLQRIYTATMFNGFVYAVAEYNPSGVYVGGNSQSSSVPSSVGAGHIVHHYVDGSASTIVSGAPAAKSITKAASRIFAASGATVKYCAAGNARDWATPSDAGFLPVQLQQDTGDECAAVGTFQKKLAVFFPASLQTWDVAVDPSANQIDQRLYGVGTLAPMSQASFSNDLAFLSPFGFRSVAVRLQTDQIDDNDLGVPVDSLVRPDMIATENLGTVAYEPCGVWIHELGQYWCIFDQGTASKAWVFTYSKTSKIGCWSEYTFPIRITDVCSLNGKVYLRSATYLYELEADQYTDDGAAIDVEVQMAFQDAKLPGVSKMFGGADMVVTGSPAFSVLYDPRDLTKESIAQTLSGDTRPGDLVPVEVVATSIAPVFRHSANEALEISALSLYFESLGPM
jgi:hypothetical protein